MSVRVVLPSEAPVGADMTMGEASAEQLRRILALKPVALTFLYELPDGVCDAASVPPSGQLSRAMVTQMHAQYYPDAKGGD